MFLDGLISSVDPSLFLSLSLTHTHTHVHTYTIDRDTDAALREVSEERSAYLNLLEEARFSISHLQDELTDARYEIIISTKTSMIIQ